MGSVADIQEIAGGFEVPTKEDLADFVTKQSIKANWKKEENQQADTSTVPAWKPETLEPFLECEPFEVFERYSDGLVELLVQETNRYAPQESRIFSADS